MQLGLAENRSFKPTEEWLRRLGRAVRSSAKPAVVRLKELRLVCRYSLVGRVIARLSIK